MNGTTEECQEDFKEQLKQDYHEDRQQAMEDSKIEYKLRTDYEFFREYNEDEFIYVIEAIQELKKLHKHYEQDFVLKDLEDELC